MNTHGPQSDFSHAYQKMFQTLEQVKGKHEETVPISNNKLKVGAATGGRLFRKILGVRLSEISAIVQRILKESSPINQGEKINLAECLMSLFDTKSAVVKSRRTVEQQFNEQNFYQDLAAKVEAVISSLKDNQDFSENLILDNKPLAGSPQRFQDLRDSDKFQILQYCVDKKESSLNKNLARYVPFYEMCCEGYNEFNYTLVSDCRCVALKTMPTIQELYTSHKTELDKGKTLLLIIGSEVQCLIPSPRGFSPNDPMSYRRFSLGDDIFKFKVGLFEGLKNIAEHVFNQREAMLEECFPLLLDKFSLTRRVGNLITRPTHHIDYRFKVSTPHVQTLHQQEESLKKQIVGLQEAFKVAAEEIGVTLEIKKSPGTNKETYKLEWDSSQKKRSFPNLAQAYLFFMTTILENHLNQKLQEQHPGVKVEIFPQDKGYTIYYNLGNLYESLDIDNMGECRRVEDKIRFGITTPLLGLTAETLKKLSPLSKINIPPMPKDLKASDLNQLMDPLFKDLTDEACASAKDEETRLPIPRSALKKALSNMIECIRTQGNHSGVPPVGPQREIFYNSLERFLRHIVIKLMEKKGQKEEVEAYVVRLAEGATHCGPRWLSEAMLLYMELIEQTEKQSEEGNLRNNIHQMIDQEKSKTIEKMAEEGLGNEGYDMTHGLAFIQRSLTDKLYELILGATSQFEDVYEQMGKEGKYSTPEKVEEGFLKKLLLVKVAFSILDQINTYLQINNEKRELLLEALREFVKKDPDVAKYQKEQVEDKYASDVVEFEEFDKKVKEEIVKHPKLTREEAERKVALESEAPMDPKEEAFFKAYLFEDRMSVLKAQTTALRKEMNELNATKKEIEAKREPSKEESELREQKKALETEIEELDAKINSSMEENSSLLEKKNEKETELSDIEENLEKIKPKEYKDLTIKFQKKQQEFLKSQKEVQELQNKAELLLNSKPERIRDWGNALVSADKTLADKVQKAMPSDEKETAGKTPFECYLDTKSIRVKSMQVKREEIFSKRQVERENIWDSALQSQGLMEISQGKREITLAGLDYLLSKSELFFESEFKNKPYFFFSDADIDLKEKLSNPSLPIGSWCIQFSPEEGGMKVFIKTVSGEIRTVLVHSDEEIHQLKLPEMLGFNP